MKQLRIDLGERSYDILIGPGLLDQTGEEAGKRIPGRRAVVVTHPRIRQLYGTQVMYSLEQSGFETFCIEIPEGETSKTIKEAERVFDFLIDSQCNRRSILVALGGGVIGDLTGFVASTFMRGIPFIQIPTTLLSQVDSSVGGKTAVNHPKGKNLIGAFYQPRLVLIDTNSLTTLPEDEYRAGLAEVIKYGIIADPALFDFLIQNSEKILNRDETCLEHLIETSCSIKAQVVERDETESEYRMILNFGHTLGHAVEALTDYSKYKHGEAVAIGMVFAAKLSRESGLCSDKVVTQIKNLVAKMKLPADLPKLETRDLIEAMYLDKKAIEKKIKFVLVRGIGEIEFVDTISESLLQKVLEN